MGQAVSKWMMDNVCVRTDSDGLVLVLALDRATRHDIKGLV